jgi:hypothetical protein
MTIQEILAEGERQLQETYATLTPEQIAKREQAAQELAERMAFEGRQYHTPPKEEPEEPLPLGEGQG